TRGPCPAGSCRVSAPGTCMASCRAGAGTRSAAATRPTSPTSALRGWGAPHGASRRGPTGGPRATGASRSTAWPSVTAGTGRGPLEPFARDVLSPARVARQGVLDPAAVTSVLDRHVSGEEDLSRQLWGLMALSFWLERRP